MILWVFRPGSRKVQDDIANSIFRNEPDPRRPADPSPNQGGVRNVRQACEKQTGRWKPRATWDGIEELNNPLPRWWVWVFYLCIIWALAYTIAYPAWPMLTRATPGLLGGIHPRRCGGRDPAL